MLFKPLDSQVESKHWACDIIIISPMLTLVVLL
jgi:hypothetical protein